jgi:hypothetical protein
MTQSQTLTTPVLNISPLPFFYSISSFPNAAQWTALIWMHQPGAILIVLQVDLLSTQSLPPAWVSRSYCPWAQTRPRACGWDYSTSLSPTTYLMLNPSCQSLTPRPTLVPLPCQYEGKHYKIVCLKFVFVLYCDGFSLTETAMIASPSGNTLKWLIQQFSPQEIRGRSAGSPPGFPAAECQIDFPIDFSFNRSLARHLRRTIALRSNPKCRCCRECDITAIGHHMLTPAQ